MNSSSMPNNAIKFLVICLIGPGPPIKLNMFLRNMVGMPPTWLKPRNSPVGEECQPADPSLVGHNHLSITGSR